MDILELKGIFEYELKRKLAQRSRSPIEELRKLISALKFYDFSNSMVLDKDQFIRGVLRTGLCGFNISDLAKVFDLYDPNKTGYINYLNFSRYLYGKEELIPIAGNKEIDDTNAKSDIDKSKFVPPGLYERNIDLNDIENNSDIKINKTNLNEINNNNIDLQNKPKRVNYHMTKSQSQIMPQTKKDFQIEKEISKEKENNDINQQETKNINYFKNLVNILRSKINTNNGITYYSFAHHLKSNEDKSTKTTSLETLISTLELLQININTDDVINFFACLDYEQTGKVLTEEILRIILGEISENRKIAIITKFSEMDKDKTGYLPIKFLKNAFNAKFHPDCFLKQKPENEVFDEFMFTFEVFCFLKNISPEKNISYRDFVEYYTPISSSIQDDNYFNDILLGSWNIDEEKHNKKITNEINMNNPNANQLNNEISNNNMINQNNQNNNIQIEQRNNFQISQNQNPNANQIFKNSYYTPPFSPDKKLGKIRYNPITNEFTTSPKYQQRNINLNPNIDTINNNAFYNIKNNNNNVKTINTQELPSIKKLRNLLANRGMKSIFIIQRMLYIYDKNQSGEIPFEKLCDIFEIYNINIAREEIFEFFEFLDKEHKGLIKYNDLIMILINNVNENRIILIQNLFDKLRKGKEYILLNDIKKYFNPDKYPDVLEQKKASDEIAFDFIDSLEIFKEYNINLKNESIINGIMTYNDFENYFKEISLSINDDKIFDYIINFCWEVDDRLNNYGNKNGYQNDNVRIRTGQQIINNKNF